jgi:hypothetical protein
MAQIAVPNNGAPGTIVSMAKGFFDRQEWRQFLTTLIVDVVNIRNVADNFVNHTHSCNAQAGTSSPCCTGQSAPQAIANGTQVPAVPTFNTTL